MKHKMMFAFQHPLIFMEFTKGETRNHEEIGGGNNLKEIQDQMILTDTLASHREFNKMKTLKADYFMEHAAVFKCPPPPARRIKCSFLTDIC